MPPLLFDIVSIPRVPAEVTHGMAGYDDDMDDSFPAPVVSWATKRPSPYRAGNVGPRPLLHS